jgi:hypothetical protein
MTIEYKQSLTELNTILHYMDIENFKKIPQKFINFINENMDTSYNPNISKNIPINEQNIKKDTRVLLALIYRDYLCDKEKKSELIQSEFKEKVLYENELREKYNPNNLFKNTQKNTDKIQEEQNIEVVVYKEQKWYQKIFAKILSILKK